MSRNKGYVYVSKNRVDRPQFRPRSSSELPTRERLSFQEDRPDSVATPPRQKTPPPPVPPIPPVPPLPNGAAVQSPPPQRIPSPEVDRGFYSSADVYSHGRLPLEPPWSRPDPMPKYKPVSSPREEKRIFVRLDDDPRTATPSSDGKTASASVSPDSEGSPTEPQKPLAKRRNTLKKKSQKIFSRRKEEAAML